MDNTPDPVITDPKPSEKPGWLIRLEEESWQAELIVSGAAIFGALQLPDLMAQFDDYLLYTINRSASWFWMAFSMFSNLMIYVLIATFLYHFALRTLWIGMVGLNSVYPDGFKPNPNFSEDYQQKVKAEFGDINGYIKKLDRRCSSIFGSGFNIVMVSIGWMTIIAALGLLAYFLRDYINQNFAFIIGVGLYLVIMVFAFMGIVMNMPKYRDTDFVKRYQFPMATVMGRIMYQFAYRPVSIVSNLMATHHVTSKWAPLKTLGIALVVGLFIGMFFSASNLKYRYYIDDYYHRIGSDTTLLTHTAYADLDDCNCQIYRPVLEREEVTETAKFTVFIPLPNREYFEMERLCDVPEVPDDLKRKKERGLERARMIDCARQYINIYINNTEIRGFDLMRHFYGATSQFGVMATLYDIPLKEGKNWVKVTTNYYNDEGDPREMYAPLYYFPDQRPEIPTE